MKDVSTGSVTLVKIDVVSSANFVKIVMTGSSSVRSGRRAHDWDGTTTAIRSNKFDVLNITANGLEVEDVNTVDVVQEIVEITVDSGAPRERLADPKEQRRRRR